MSGYSGEAAFYGHPVLGVSAGLILLSTARMLCKGHVTLEELLGSGKHCWRFLGSAQLELQGLS
jgi:hypothetical protein